MNKEQIYKQIDTFVDKREGKSKLYEIKFYVDTQTAKDRANFTQWIFKNDKVLKDKKFNKIIDLCYGSGNLTSHILYESNIDTQNLVLNDKNIDDRNNKIQIGTKTDNDFLDAEKFKDKYDLIIFNPQIGGTDTYPQGSVEFKKTVEPIIYDGSFEEYLNSKGVETGELNISVNEIEKSITIHSDTLSKSKMKKIFKDIKVFNYHDIFYQSKETKVEGAKTNIVNFRKTLDKISHNNSVVIFLGETTIYETLFADYSYVILYLPNEGKQLYILTKSDKKKLCYQYKENKFEINKNCKKENASDNNTDIQIEKYIKELDELVVDGNNLFNSNKSKKQTETETFITKEIDYNFSHKNLLLKGVPGTGKSHTLENIIENSLNLKDNPNNICRINIHSASSNADLMQGIGINSNGGKIEYKEKQGLIYNHIKKALFTPNQPFVLVLEEIQENSLNELIGDLIYLIEEKKRVIVDGDRFEDSKEYEYQAFIDEVLKDEKNKHYIEIPYLINTSTVYRKMVLPNNLYVFCTSNYRDDKKVIEDNLLRRFDVVEIYPQTQDELGKEIFKSKEVSDFLCELNRLIEEQFKDEIHSDRYLVGHANWLSIIDEENEANKRLFYTALLKVLVEFKEIREVDFHSYVKPIVEELFKDEKKLYSTIKRYLDECGFKYESYKEMVSILQVKIYDFLKKK